MKTEDKETEVLNTVLKAACTEWAYTSWASGKRLLLTILQAFYLLVM